MDIRPGDLSVSDVCDLNDIANLVTISLCDHPFSYAACDVRDAETVTKEVKIITTAKDMALYVNGLIEALNRAHVGCYKDDMCLNNLSYADDIVLLSASI